MDKDVLEKIWLDGMRYNIQQKKEEILALIDKVGRVGVVLEIGVYDGGTTVCFANICKRLVCCDFVQRSDFVELRKMCNFTFVRGDSHSADTKQKIVSALGGELVDLLFIDGNHTEDGCMQDYRMYKELVRGGGHIAFHDILADASEHGKNIRVYVAWEAAKKEHAVWEEIILQHRRWGGIGVVQTAVSDGK